MKPRKPIPKIWRDEPCRCAPVIRDVERVNGNEYEVYCTSCGGTGRYLQPVRCAA